MGPELNMYLPHASYRRSSHPEEVEILFDSDLSATPSKRRKGNAGKGEQVEPMKWQVLLLFLGSSVAISVHESRLLSPAPGMSLLYMHS